MRDIYISSDWHLFHSNILGFKDYDGNLIRPGFSDVHDMNDKILTSHNEIVKVGDIHYNLGDVFMGSREDFKKFFPKFNGSKRLTPGNHDDIQFLSSGGFFQKVQIWRVFSDFGLVFSHVPLHESSLFRGKTGKPYINVHGHIHNNNSPKGPYVNLSVEKIGYKPVHIEEIHALWKAQQIEQYGEISEELL